MKIAVFSTKPYDREFLEISNKEHQHQIKFFKYGLNSETMWMAKDYPVVCPFVNDILDKEVLTYLYENNTRLITLRSAGFNNVDVQTAEELGMTVVRVPAYSPYAVAEHTVSLILALNRKIYKAHSRVRDGNFSLDGLLGFDLNGKTVGIIGTGKIGTVVAKILNGFGCNLLAYDSYENEECKNLGVKYVGLSEILHKSDIITLHCPLTPETKYMINSESIKEMKDGVMIINTSRGALIDTKAVTKALKSGKIGYLGLDVYEEEANIFFEDLSNTVIKDDIFARLLTFPNVIITGHQAFFTKNALENIAQTALENVTNFEKNIVSPINLVTSKCIIKNKK